MKPFQLLVMVLLVGIVASLGKSLFHMSSGPAHSAQMARALTWRIALSVTLFIVLFIGWRLGLLSPHEVRP
jgi:cytochrome bd-type quinol oxidase subunit 2